MARQQVPEHALWTAHFSTVLVPRGDEMLCMRQQKAASRQRPWRALQRAAAHTCSPVELGSSSDETSGAGCGASETQHAAAEW